MNELKLVSSERCLIARGSIKSCLKCRLYMNVCKGDSDYIVNYYSDLIKKDQQHANENLSVA
jgi:hypothetical protein